MKSSATSVDSEEYIFSASEIDSFMKIRQDYLDGKTSTRPRSEIKEMLNDKYGGSKGEKPINNKSNR